ncbi:hypothetical protein PRIPAC_84052 [Pristionchus pacificus]|uniref:Uncharacterized protein n=1 Tax=Pristionchus pacificus TaxID=54126 RepID=A0A2A6C4V9_PRIPA|nr:hypothetical protein PRIPAC_84052 [Pristionchus pacificus]|eukprot:PDM73169.1 hypothetical protein PRIPAC_43265 [Pristionchus pacificus]
MEEERCPLWRKNVSLVEEEVEFEEGPISSLAEYYGETHIFKVWVCPNFGDASYSFDKTPVEIGIRGAVIFPRVDVKGDVKGCEGVSK